MDPQHEPSPPRRQRLDRPPTRPGAVALAAVLTELVVIAAVGNQWIAERAGHWIANERSAFVADLKATLLVYNWRFAPQQGDVEHSWLSQLVMIALTLALTGAFVSVVVRGPATMGRVFVTCWMAAVCSTALASYVRAALNKQPGIAGTRVQKTFFGPLAPSAISVFAAIVLGLLAGSVAVVVARMLRNRTPVGTPVAAAPAEPPYVPPEQPPPYYPVPRPAPSRSAEATVEFPRPPDDDDLGPVHSD
jgi:hypothetical protein